MTDGAELADSPSAEPAAAPAASPGATPAAPPAAPDASAAPSTATDGANPPGQPDQKADAPWSRDKLLAVVRSAAKEPQGPAPATEPKTTAQSDPAGAAADGADPAIPEPFSKHPAWQRIARNRDEYKAKADTFQRELESQRPIVENAAKISAFMRSTGVTDAQGAEALAYAALINKEPRKAREAIAQLLGRLDQELGNVLPPDLQAEVASGMLSEDHARQLSQARQDARRAQAQAQSALAVSRDTAAAAAQREQAQRVAAHAEACSSAVNAWAEQQVVKDPDFASIVPLALDRIGAIVRKHGYPPTVQDAVGVANFAVRQVKAEMARFRPAPATPPRPPAGGSAGTRTAARNWKDAVYIAAGQPLPP